MTRALGFTRVDDHGLEHLLLGETSADGIVVAVDEQRRPFRLGYHLRWEPSWRLREARLAVTTEGGTQSLTLEGDGNGRWRDGQGRARPELDGCVDIDIWPTPFTNTFPIRREPMAIGDKRVLVVAWVAAPALIVRPSRQAYTRIAERRYRFESLDGDVFSAELVVDDEALVIEYEGLFRRLA